MFGKGLGVRVDVFERFVLNGQGPCLVGGDGDMYG